MNNVISETAIFYYSFGSKQICNATKKNSHGTEKPHQAFKFSGDLCQICQLPKQTENCTEIINFLCPSPSKMSRRKLGIYGSSEGI